MAPGSGPQEAHLQYPAKNRTGFSWVRLFHYTVGAVLWVENFLTLLFVVAFGYTGSVNETRQDLLEGGN